MGEIGNCYAHISLTKHGAVSKQKYSLPDIFLFQLVSCPHYMFEMISWLGFSILTQTIPSLLFFVMGSAIMIWWSNERFVRYKKLNGNFSAARVIPYLY